MRTAKEKQEYCSTIRDMLQGMVKIYNSAQEAKYKTCEEARFAWTKSVLTGNDGIDEFRTYLSAQTELFEMLRQSSASLATTCSVLRMTVDAWVPDDDDDGGQECPKVD